ncbi:4-hydroxy-tetrahydrodipicolinate reductase [Dokdonella sp.]|uniref:4-hydroxy-tetrahydrodipicolinate reductase n=1 Tax=Dokdonella sp. TaxID=2291710 RepID=UPI0035294C2C
MNEPIRLIVFGAAGRMGQAVLRIASENSGFEVAVAVVRERKDDAGNAVAANYATVVDAGTGADAVLDFSGTAGFNAALDLAVQRRLPLVSGSTGLSDAQQAAMAAAASKIPVLWAANFSLGVAVLAHLAAQAASLLPDWDCEIIEAHHRLKTDAPSGTALTLGERVNASRGRPNDPARIDRSGKRAPGAIGYSVSRAGDIIGEHEVRLAGSGERLELIHRAGDRDLFARGALAGARWIVGKPAGLHQVGDVLGLARR